jgi:hypothetical protein
MTLHLQIQVFNCKQPLFFENLHFLFANTLIILDKLPCKMLSTPYVFSCTIIKNQLQLILVLSFFIFFKC